VLQVDARGHHGVVQEAAHAADLDLVRPPLTADAVCGFVVPAAMCCLVVLPQDTHGTLFAPLIGPGVLNGPVILITIFIAKADKKSKVVDDGVLWARVHDPAAI